MLSLTARSLPTIREDWERFVKRKMHNCFIEGAKMTFHIFLDIVVDNTKG